MLFLQGERRIRGTAIYPQASFLNHECLPNVARFDHFDSPHTAAPQNTAVRPCLVIIYTSWCPHSLPKPKALNS